jgi:hypothetical protein
MSIGRMEKRYRLPGEIRFPQKEEGKMRHWCAIVCLTCGVIAATAPAVADMVVLANGVEVRNAKIINETDHVVTLQIIGNTRLVLGKSEIDRIERREVAAVEPVRPEPEPVRLPIQPVTPPQSPLVAPAPGLAQITAPTAPGMSQVLKVAALQPGIILEFRLDISPETGLSYMIYPSGAPADARSRTYTVVATDGSQINVSVVWDAQGNVTDSIIEPPTPPIDAEEAEYEYTVEAIGGGTFKIQAIWDVLNSEIIMINILLL